MYCTSCGNEANPGARFCSKCGKEFNSSSMNTSNSVGTRDQVKKEELIYPKDKIPSKWIIAWSLLLPGIPQFILGQSYKGVMFVAFAIVFFFIPDLPFVVSVVMGVMSMLQANKAINTLRSGKPITKWDDVPPPGYDK
jgi:TM2 domain-containing membrane protein YozV